VRFILSSSRLNLYLYILLCHSVCIRDIKEAFSVKPRFEGQFQYKVLDVEDTEDQNLIRLFPEYVVSTIWRCLLTHGCTVRSDLSTKQLTKADASLFIAMVCRNITRSLCSY